MYKINDIPSFWGLVYNAIVLHGKVLKNAQLENTDGKKKLKVSCALDVEGKKNQVTTK